MNKNKIITIILFFGLISVILGFLFFNNDGEIYSCKEDEECMIVSLTCCGCAVANLNTPIEELLTSINKNFLLQWNEDIKERCEATACAAGVNLEQLNRCNSYVPKCIKNLCSFVNVAEEEK